MFWKVLVLGRVFLNRKGRKDRYSGITVIEGNLPDVDAETFSNVLKASLVSWIGDGTCSRFVLATSCTHGFPHFSELPGFQLFILGGLAASEN